MTVSTIPAPREPQDGWRVLATAPIVTGERLPDGVDPATLSRFGDDRWDLSPLSRRHNEPARSINWTTFPVTLRQGFKRAGWALLNLPTPAQLLERTATARVERPSTGTIARTTENWRRYANWLAGRGITDLTDVDPTDHDEYAVYLANLNLAHGTRTHALYAVSLLWGFAPHLPSSDRVPMPPWEAEGMEHYLPANAEGNENATPPIHPAVMSPLLVWALRFVEDFADDILDALAAQQHLRAQISDRYDPDAGARLKALLDAHLQNETPLPGEFTHGRLGVALSYLAAVTGASITQVNNRLCAYGHLPVAEATPLPTPITGLLHDEPWKPHINYHEAPALAMRLATACLIVITYLSGIRPSEALNLRVGCCPDPIGDDRGTLRYHLHGDYFKGAHTPEGDPAPDGAARETPWTIIPPVHTAVRVLEHLTTNEYLFPVRPGWLSGIRAKKRKSTDGRTATQGSRYRKGAVITAKSANQRIAEFIRWVNAYASERGVNFEIIPTDPDGPVVISRFRRTIAWHIARLPGGRIALAIQYGHLRTTISEGYSGRARHGLRRVLDFETAHSMADYLHRITDRIEDGEGVSGPAAQRLLDAARDAATRFEGMFLSPRQVRALLSDPRLQVYDNPEAFLTCNHDPSRALCHPDRTAGRVIERPSRDRCNPACANIARTDEHMTALSTEIERLQAESAHPMTPMPMRERLAQRAAALEQIADRHRRTRIMNGDTDAGG